VDQEIVKGSTTAFCTFSPFKSLRARLWEWVVLKGSPVNNEPVRARNFLHYAYFARVLPSHLERAGIAPRGKLRFGALLFISAYNGSAEAYFRGFSEHLHEQMNSLWEGCTDWETAKVYENLDRFITMYRRRSGFYFNAYEDRSSNLRSALALRAELDELIATAHGDPVEFLEGYRRAAQVAWGNGGAS
jgi:hypothetical protein